MFSDASVLSSVLAALGPKSQEPLAEDVVEELLARLALGSGRENQEPMEDVVEELLARLGLGSGAAGDFERLEKSGGILATAVVISAAKLSALDCKNIAPSCAASIALVTAKGVDRISAIISLRFASSIVCFRRGSPLFAIFQAPTLASILVLSRNESHALSTFLAASVAA